MSFIQIFVLAVIQGVSEFAPISSSAHLILVSKFLNWPDQGLSFDIILHIGTFLAILIYFSKDLFCIIKGLSSVIKTRKMNDHVRLFFNLCIATVPIVLVGGLVSYFDCHPRDHINLIAFNGFIFAILLWLADRNSQKQEKLLCPWYYFLLIGVAQSLAVMPGVSRSGVSITMCLFLGFNSVQSIRFSFLMGIPAIVLSIGHTILNCIPGEILWKEIFIGIFLSLLVGLFTISFLMSWLKKNNFLPFVIYRIILTILLLLSSTTVFKFSS